MSKTTHFVINSDPLTLQLKKNGHPVSETVAKSYCQKNFPDKEFKFHSVSRALIATEKKKDAD